MRGKRVLPGEPGCWQAAGVGCARGTAGWGLSSPGGAWVMLGPSPGHHAAGEGWHETRSAWFQHQKWFVGLEMSVCISAVLAWLLGESLSIPGVCFPSRHHSPSKIPMHKQETK